MSAPPLVTATVRNAIQRHSMVARGDTLCVAVSGGPDSTALLSALSHLRQELGISLHVVHVDHGLRGAESETDADAVRSLSDRLGLSCTVARADIPGLRRQYRIGIEEAARIARHRFFAEVTRPVGAAAVALGHTADDQAETVLMHLIRGTGLQGLAGMRPIADLQVEDADSSECYPLRLVRPLLAATRLDVLEYLTSEKLPYRQDSSNFSPEYTRNRVRSSVLETLRAENPRVVDALARLASSAADGYDYLHASAIYAIGSLARPSDDGLSVDLAAWKALPAALRREGLRCIYARLRGSSIDFTSAHVEAALECIECGHVGARIDWPDGLSLVIGYRDFAVGATPGSVEYRVAEPETLDVPGRLDLPDGRHIIAQACSRSCDWSREDRGHADLAAASIRGRLKVRQRRDGDRLIPLGMTGSRKVQDLLVDARVPRLLRDSVPVVEDDLGIVWLAGVRQSERCRVTDASREVVCLRVLNPCPT